MVPSGHPAYDVDDIVQDEDTGEILGGCYWVDTYKGDFKKGDFKSAKLSANLKGLSKFFNDERNLFIVSQSNDDKQWVLLAEGPDNAYFLYDVDAHHLSPLGDRYPKLDEEHLSKTRRFSFKTRDNVVLSAYVTEPPGSADHLRPLVVMPHGGPEVRDKYTFDTLAQYLAPRGYVVLQPNFRGSGGFGRKFAEAGYGQWGARMHEDVMDSAKALVAEGKVDPKRVCIVGGSYGGYEAMYAAATEPDTFKCAVSFDGVSDLVGIVKFERSYGTDSATWA